MNKDESKKKILDVFNKGLDDRISVSGQFVELTFWKAWIFVVMFDNRLKAGENKRKVMVANTDNDDVLMTFTEKILTVQNHWIKKDYQYRTTELDILSKPIDSVIQDIKQQLPLMVDAFLEQVERNNAFLYPTQQKTKRGNWRTRINKIP